MRDVELPEVVEPEPGATGPTFSQGRDGYVVVEEAGVARDSRGEPVDFPMSEEHKHAHGVPSQVDTEATDGTTSDEPASSPERDGI